MQNSLWMDFNRELDRFEEMYASKRMEDEIKKQKDKKMKWSGSINDSLYIKKVIYSNPVTVIEWSDGVKTSSRCQEGDVYNPETGLAIAFLKRLHGVEETVRLLTEWTPKNSNQKVVSLRDLRKEERNPHEKG